ncbi:Periplasmic nitrate reductase [Ceratobasidium theobromae]|uniref:Periplasmic nitrate reductase n=1 Tax=Ceratobasidium theobromae TaxID=1582974 RepID=A0A5N5Q9T5_9AGAM|nr:Periplasmic nitrate reductase [Ceratobasidium theobromae]
MTLSKKRQNLLEKAQRATEGSKARWALLMLGKTSIEQGSPDNQPRDDLDEDNITLDQLERVLEEAIPAGNDGNTTDSAMQDLPQAPEINIVNGEPTELSSSAINRPPTAQEAKNALQKVIEATWTRRGGGYIHHDLDYTTRRRFDAMESCLANYTKAGSKGFLAESMHAATGQSKSATYAQSICKWIRELINTGDLPYFRHGWWNVPLLGDEDVVREIKTYLQSVGKYASAKDIVKFLSDPGTHTQLQVPHPISICTAQRWMTQYEGFRWHAELKGQYFDGHERADVVEYRQSTFIPFWRAHERLMTIYNENGIPDPQRPMFLLPGQRPVIFWFHDESIFYANDRRLVRWVGEDKHATPYKKGKGNTIMVADFMCAWFGWLRGKNGETARVIFRPGSNRDGYFTCNRVVAQLENAIKIVQETFPDFTHIFIYDNAPSHTKRPEDAISAKIMPKGEVEHFPRPYVVKGTGQRVVPARMEPGRLPDGMAQSFYYPDDHPRLDRRGWFKGMAQILRERGLGHIAERRAQCPGFKCEPGRTDCCCRRALLSQPDFETRDSSLEEAALKHGSRVCWGHAKKKYREMPPTNKESVMERYITDAIDSIPLSSIRKFAARSQRFVDAYASGSGGSEAIKWATKQFRSHRQTPAHIPFEQIAPGYVHS